jgi:hypothetical protein
MAAVDVTTTKVGGGGDMWVGASGSKAGAATTDEVTITAAQIWHQEGVEVCPSVPTLEAEQ